jgi:hypothetical protein
MSRADRASRWHLRRLVAVPLAIAAATAIAACGGGGPAKKAASVKSSPAALVSQTFSASNTINSGRVALAVTLALDGVKQLGGKPVTLDVSGPFQRGAGNDISTDLTATVQVASSTVNIGIDKVGKKLYLGLAGTFYALPASSTAKPSTGATGAEGMLSALGIDPKTWLTNPHIVGTESVGGVSTEHLTAQIDVANVLNDVSKLVSRATGSTGAGTSSDTLALIESAITSAQVDVYTGVADHIVRRFDLAIGFTVPQIATSALGGLTGGSLKLDVTLAELNQPQTITAPANPQPSSKLLNGVFALESQFGSLASLFSGISSGTSTGG